MSEYFAVLNSFSLASVIYRILLATFIGGIIGVERSKHGRAAGLRTHILICVGSALISLLGIYVYEYLEYDTDPVRIAAQVVSGIGFLGAGSILIKNRDIVTGLTTAAGMWVTSAIGLCVGFGFYEGAIIGTIVTIISISFLNLFETSKKESFRLYVEINEANKVNEVLEKIKEVNSSFVLLHLSSPKTLINGNVGMYYKCAIRKEEQNEENIDKLIKQLLKIEYVIFVIEE